MTFSESFALTGYQEKILLADQLVYTPLRDPKISSRVSLCHFSTSCIYLLLGLVWYAYISLNNSLNFNWIALR